MIKVVKPDIKPENLVCPDEPIPAADIVTDVGLTKWAESVRSAGADCRNKLAGVKKALAD